MRFLRDILDKVEPNFEKGGKLEKLYPLYEMVDTFAYTPDTTCSGGTHVKDQIDLKRVMITVAMALVPCILFGIFNVGYQANLGAEQMGLEHQGWRADIIRLVGIGFASQSFVGNFIHGLLYFLPVFIVTNVVGGFWEALFALTRKHEINEGFLVTGLLFPLTLPPTIPLWQVALGISFGVVVGKEIFGGTGKNFLNPALTARAFLYFAYPAQITGDAIWTAVDGLSSATPLGQAALTGMNDLSHNLSQAFIGLIPGSMGETSVLMCLFGAFYLIYTGIGSWRIMFFTLLGFVGTIFLLQSAGSDSNVMFEVPIQWHLAIGGFAFGTVFMATDPVSAAVTNKGQMFYGLLIGLMTALVRIVNPAFPEGIMLAILFGNIFAPLIDWLVVNANIKRRAIRVR